MLEMWNGKAPKKNHKNLIGEIIQFSFHDFLKHKN